MKTGSHKLASGAILLGWLFWAQTTTCHAQAGQSAEPKVPTPDFAETPASAMRVLEILLARFAEEDFQSTGTSGLNEFLQQAEATNVLIQGPFENLVRTAGRPAIDYSVPDPHLPGCHVLVAHVDPLRLESLREKIHQGKHSELLSTPTVFLRDGYPGEVSNGAVRPYVTNVEPVASHGVIAMQPLVSLIPEGFALSAITQPAEEDFVRLDVRLTSRYVHAAEEVGTDSGSGTGPRVQFPDVTVSQVEAAALMKTGGTIVMIPAPSFDRVHDVANPKHELNGRLPGSAVMARQKARTRLVVFVTLKDAPVRAASSSPALPSATVR